MGSVDVYFCSDGAMERESGPSGSPAEAVAQVKTSAIVSVVVSVIASLIRSVIRSPCAEPQEAGAAVPRSQGSPSQMVKLQSADYSLNP